ncbi:MAG: response regulator, partial [Solirubrobacterales bacterium]
MDEPARSPAPIISLDEPLGVVVVAEDDEATLELLCDNLTADRFDVIPAPSAADALRQCHYRNPDLLLLDLELPDASGLDVLREIRRAERTTGRYDSKLPVIVLSGRSSETDR